MLLAHFVNKYCSVLMPLNSAIRSFLYRFVSVSGGNPSTHFSMTAPYAIIAHFKKCTYVHLFNTVHSDYIQVLYTTQYTTLYTNTIYKTKLQTQRRALIRQHKYLKKSLRTAEIHTFQGAFQTAVMRLSSQAKRVRTSFITLNARAWLQNSCTFEQSLSASISQAVGSIYLL